MFLTKFFDLVMDILCALFFSLTLFLVCRISKYDMHNLNSYAIPILSRLWSRKNSQGSDLKTYTTLKKILEEGIKTEMSC